MTARRRDLTGALLAFGFVLLLLASEAALSLPDETAGADALTSFYVAHRGVVVGLQLAGFAAAGLLAAYAVRLRRAAAAVAWTGLLTAVLGLAPGAVTLAVAALATSAPDRAVAWNRRGPLADDLLFLAVPVFAGAVAVVRTGHPVLRVLGAATAVLCVARLVLERTGSAGSGLASAAPVAFVVLVAALGVASLRGTLPAVGVRRTSVSHHGHDKGHVPGHG